MVKNRTVSSTKVEINRFTLKRERLFVFLLFFGALFFFATALVLLLAGVFLTAFVRAIADTYLSRSAT